jgi:hypothetical protein
MVLLRDYVTDGAVSNEQRMSINGRFRYVRMMQQRYCRAKRKRPGQPLDEIECMTRLTACDAATGPLRRPANACVRPEPSPTSNGNGSSADETRPTRATCHSRPTNRSITSTLYQRPARSHRECPGDAVHLTTSLERSVHSIHGIMWQTNAASVAGRGTAAAANEDAAQRSASLYWPPPMLRASMAVKRADSSGGALGQSARKRGAWL